jgi:hypothetical protein
MFEQHWFAMGMPAQDSHGFGAAIASKANDSDGEAHWLFIHHYE